MSTPEARQRNVKYRAKRRAFFLEVVGDTCATCGTAERLEFDHVNAAEKKYEIALLPLTLRREEVLAELAKCQTLCHACHSAKTGRENGKRNEGSFTHGSDYAVMRKKCRCAVCAAAYPLVLSERAARQRKVGGRGPLGPPSTHGERRHYKRGCRCELCKQASAEYMRAYRATKRAA